MLMQGLYTYIQNHMGGALGAARMILDRVAPLVEKSAESEPTTRLGKLVKRPGRIMQSTRKYRKVQDELILINDLMDQNARNLEKMQRNLKNFAASPVQNRSSPISSWPKLWKKLCRRFRL